ncbi:SAM-dependent methyltransferase [Streptomyces sp. SRF1]|uniref:SAM-dependent methyltransferase n=1 Tax=Streptomyces sp. SRF1 TaxID=1549642 RepID=UPI0025AF3B3C|nr:SAM-dependent methyltransferase [Streptomyces sp. SRF1]MDN3057865.1 SAM-dependent methyltransferase [Streptomyces sp. SRF1]
MDGGTDDTAARAAQTAARAARAHKSHATGDFADRSAAQAVYDKATAPLNLRSHAEIERFFDGFTLVEPGLAQVPFWRPDAPPPTRPGEIGYYGGVARKTG